MSGPGVAADDDQSSAGVVRRRRRRVERRGVPDEHGVVGIRPGRDRKVTVRLTDAEYVAIERRAVVAGLSTASYLAEVGMKARLPGPSVGGGVREVGGEQGRGFGVLERRSLAAELAGLRRLLGGIGTNLNQLAKVANATGEVPPALPSTVLGVRRYVARLSQVVAALDPSVDPSVDPRCGGFGEVW